MANIFIQIQKPFYFAGEIVNGYVYFNVYSSHMAGRQLDIKLKGWQSVRWLQTRQITSQQQINIIPIHLIYNAKAAHISQNSSDSSDSQLEERKINGDKQYYKDQWGQIHQVTRYHGQNIMVKFKSTLYNFGGESIPQGQFSFPFSFKSGQNWAASYIDKGTAKQRKGRIKYQLKASVQGINGKKKKQIKFKTEVIIRQSVSIKAQIKQMNANVVSCCCIDKGTSKIKCYFDKNAYSIGEEAIVYCSLDNTACKSNITQIQISLVNDITYTSQKNYSKTFTNLLFTKSFGGLGAGQKQQKTQQVKILNQKNPNKFDIKPTSRGRFLKSIYYLKVQAHLDAACTCCSQLPIVHQSILIYPQNLNLMNWNAPNDWQPKVMPNFIINMAFNGMNNQMQKMKNLYY